nr:E3 ubiquitin/ISG15 ligase TRIM25-like [Misgurnus anguillicaudatus]
MAKSSRAKRRRNKSLNESQLMSSSSDPMTEELQCSICLDVYNDPVSTSCGHNFCKICLNTYWDNSENSSCPNCKETFNKRPDLKINTTLREVVHHHKKTAEKPEVLCDICEEVKRKALKSCLLLAEMEEKQKAAEKQYEDLIKDQEQKITELKRRNTELEKITKTNLIQVTESLSYQSCNSLITSLSS